MLELAPGPDDALTLLYNIRKAQGGRCRGRGAVAAASCRIDPNNFWATNELALIAARQGGDSPRREIHARNAVRIAPENPQSHNLMGMIMTEANRPQIGEYHYRRVLELAGRRDPIVLANLAWNLKNQGRMAEARALYEESVAAAPEILQTVLGWARMEEADRNFRRAAELLDRAERCVAGQPEHACCRAPCCTAACAPTTRPLRCSTTIARRASGRARRPNELLEKGRLLDRMGRYDEAFAAFVEGKRLRARAQRPQLHGRARAATGRPRSSGFFTAGRLAILPRAGVRATTSPQPMFILGFPRSGTTLVEQTLSAHPRISAGDELPFINEITDVMPRMLAQPARPIPRRWPSCGWATGATGSTICATITCSACASSASSRPGAAWFTDKMPLNETHLGLIALMFPRSPMIHVLRHPLDVVLSVFSNHLTHGFYCAYDAGERGAALRADDGSGRALPRAR